MENKPRVQQTKERRDEKDIEINSKRNKNEKRKEKERAIEMGIEKGRLIRVQ